MALLPRLLLFVLCAHLAHFTDPDCVIELECAECIPDNMPAVTSHRARNGSVRVAAGELVSLQCAGGKFLAYPLRAALDAACEAGRFRVRHDGALRHLLHLGCQENIFEDVLHQVEGCAAPLQGRVYRVGAVGGAGGEGGVRHVAALCYDAERALGVRLQAAPALAPHAEHTGPLSLLGNFNHMFDAKTRHDAERLYSDDLRLNRRLRQLFKHDGFSFADQTLTSAKLLSGRYFDEFDARATDFVSNRVAVWASVARGNLAHVQRDVARALRPGLHVFAGTHGVLTLETDVGRTEVYLGAGNRFPVPKYIWTVVHDPQRAEALAILVLNDPFAAASAITEAAPCASACPSVPWLRALGRGARAGRPLYGLAWCCALPAAAARVPELPALDASAGMLTDV